MNFQLNLRLMFEDKVFYDCYGRVINRILVRDFRNHNSVLEMQGRLVFGQAALFYL